MIHSVRIPRTVNRLGCAPGAGCCSSCGDHNKLRGTSRRMGETVCDDSGNCWADGVLVSAPLTTGPGCPPGVATCNSIAGIPPMALYIGGGIIAALVLTEILGRRR